MSVYKYGSLISQM